MPQICSACRHPQRTQIEQALVRGTSLRDIAAQFGTAKTIIARHRTHVAGTIARRIEAQESVRTATLLDDVRAAERRAESLYRQAEEILTAALTDNDRPGALQAIRTAAHVMAEGRGYMGLRGQLTGETGKDRTAPPMSIQIICPSAGSSEPPRVVFGQDDGRTIEGEAIEVESEIGIAPRR
jgi:hypothetical protein